MLGFTDAEALFIYFIYLIKMSCPLIDIVLGCIGVLAPGVVGQAELDELYENNFLLISHNWNIEHDSAKVCNILWIQQLRTILFKLLEIQILMDKKLL